MKQDQKKTIEKRMREEITQLQKSITEREANQAPVEPDASIGRLSRLDNMLNQAVSGASLSQARERLQRLTAALEHIDDDDFGICMECGEPIGSARLLALPETEYCVDCAE